MKKRRNMKMVLMLAMVGMISYFVGSTVASDNAEISEASETTTAIEVETEVEAETEVESLIMYATACVNVRKDSETSSSRLGTLDEGEAVSVLGFDDMWAIVEYNGDICYVAREYLSENPYEESYRNHSSSRREVIEIEEVETATVPETTVAVETTTAPSVEETKAPEETKHECKFTVTNTVEPTCSASGYSIYTCECGESYNGTEIAATGHSYKDETVKATTEAQGYILHTCEKCGYSYSDNFTEKLEVESKEEPTNPAESEEAEPTGHAHAEKKRGGYTYVYCSEVESPYRDGNMIYYPYDYYY